MRATKAHKEFDMTITQDMVVSMGYVLKNDEGTIIDQSGEQPLVYLHGHRNIVPGLERALDGLAVGESKRAKVSPADGYGEYDPQLKFAIPKDRIGDQPPPVDSLVQLQNPNGQTFVARVAEFTEKEVILDANHPLAGENLNFEVTIVDIRKAEPEELAHGHVHGPGGHHH